MWGCLSYRGLGWLKSRKCLSVKMKELMGSICCSCVESVKFRCPQHLLNSGHVIRLWKIIILWSTAENHLHTWLVHLLAAFILRSCHRRLHVPRSYYSFCLEERKPLIKKGSQMHINLPVPSPSSARQPKATSQKSSKVKHSTPLHHGSLGCVCGGRYPWLLTPYRSSHHLATTL